MSQSLFLQDKELSKYGKPLDLKISRFKNLQTYPFIQDYFFNYMRKRTRQSDCVPMHIIFQKMLSFELLSTHTLTSYHVIGSNIKQLKYFFNFSTLTYSCFCVCIPNWICVPYSVGTLLFILCVCCLSYLSNPRT